MKVELGCGELGNEQQDMVLVFGGCMYLGGASIPKLHIQKALQFR